MKILAKVFFIEAVSFFIETVLPNLMSFATIILFSVVSKKPLLSNYVVLILSYFGTICDSIGCYLKAAVESTIRALVSFRRVEVIGIRF